MMLQPQKFAQKLRDGLVNRLEASVQVSEPAAYNNMDKLYGSIRKGDVVLVDGQSRMSAIIKLFSRSQWSHVGLYVGDELVRESGKWREEYITAFGDEARHLMVEAFVGQGVVASPLSKYQNNNLRICRPFGITKNDLNQVMAKVIANLGKNYDQRNIIDIALMLLPGWLNPFRKRSIKACLGNCNEFQVICSGMIAKAFQSVRYPIVPATLSQPEGARDFTGNPYGGKLIMRHYSQIMPRDFDLSPNFEIIKFNIIEAGTFGYRSLWHDDEVARRGEEGP
jgi:hypothetical protein